MKIYINSGKSELFRVTGSEICGQKVGARKENGDMLVEYLNHVDKEFEHHVL